MTGLLLLVPIASFAVWILAYVLAIHQHFEFRGEGREVSRLGAFAIATLVTLALAVVVAITARLDGPT